MAACASPLADYSGYVAPRAYPFACEDAFRYAAKALKANGFAVSRIERGEAGGVIEGEREKGGSMKIALTCDASGVWVTPSGETPFAENGMRIAFERVAEEAQRKAPMPTGLEFEAELIREPETQLYFSTPLAPRGLVALRMRVANGGDRDVDVDPSAARLRTAEGRLAAPVPLEELRTRLAAKDAARLPEMLLPRTRLQQRQSIRGFLFFPAGDYAAALFPLVDTATGEPEEFEASLS